MNYRFCLSKDFFFTFFHIHTLSYVIINIKKHLKTLFVFMFCQAFLTLLH